MNIESFCNSFIQDKIIKDTLNIKYPERFDYSIYNYVINNTPNINHISYRGKIIFKNYAIKASLKQFKIFNEENNHKLLNIIKTTEFIKDYPPNNFGVATTYDISLSKIINPGYVTTYHIPKKIYDVDIISLGHEHCHALKETNYNEHKNQLTLGEVIPIFYELINYENNFLKQKCLEYRLFCLKEQKERYLAISHFIRQNKIYEYDNIYEYAKNYLGSYFGGFYYAIILYNMYKIDPIKILNLVNQVLSHKITTLDMLKKLNIHHNILGTSFETEMTIMKKVLTK